MLLSRMSRLVIWRNVVLVWHVRHDVFGQTTALLVALKLELLREKTVEEFTRGNFEGVGTADFVGLLQNAYLPSVDRNRTSLPPRS